MVIWRSLFMRLTALAFLALGLAGAISGEGFDVAIAPTGASAALRLTDGKLAVIGARPNPFEAEQWLRADGDAREARALLALGTYCDKLGCVGKLVDGSALALVMQEAAFEEDCLRADIIVSPRRAPSTCAAPLIFDRESLASSGAVTLRIAGDGFLATTARSPDEDRPWSRPPNPTRQTSASEGCREPRPRVRKKTTTMTRADGGFAGARRSPAEAGATPSRITKRRKGPKRSSAAIPRPRARSTGRKCESKDRFISITAAERVAMSVPRRAFIGVQKSGPADILPLARCRSDEGGKRCRVAQPEVEALRADRRKGVRGLTDEREAPRADRAHMRNGQRHRAARAGEVHLAEDRMRAPLDRERKRFIVEGRERLGFRAPHHPDEARRLMRFAGAPDGAASGWAPGGEPGCKARRVYGIRSRFLMRELVVEIPVKAHCGRRRCVP